MLNTNLSNELKRLRLPGMADNLDLRIREAEANKLGYLELVQLLVQDERSSRDSNSFSKRLRTAGVSNRMTFENFDFEFNGATMAPKMIRDLATCYFLEQRRNLVLAGPPGIGKSHIAQAIGHEAARRGYDVVVFKTHKLLERLAADGHSPKRAELLLKRCLSSGLLVLDDFAFRPYDRAETELLYTLADEALGERSIIVTSNRPPEDWFSVFPDPIVGGAIMDRLVSGAIKIMVTSGRSYRKEGALWKDSVIA